MKHTSRLSILLACLLVLSVFAGGSGGNDKPPETTTAETTAAEPAETADPSIVTDDLGDIDLEGKTFTLYCVAGYTKYIVTEETGEPINDACFQRNSAVEERFNLKLNFYKGFLGGDGNSLSQSTQNITAVILAGDSTYDTFTHVQHTGMPGLILQGMFMDWHKVPHVDFAKPYWYSKVIAGNGSDL